jgi:hypothetical protein
MASLLKIALYNHAGCQVVGNGLAAVRAIRESPPDAIDPGCQHADPQRLSSARDHS